MIRSSKSAPAAALALFQTAAQPSDNLPALIGAAVGALADPTYAAPVRSVFEQSKHIWVQIDGAAEHFEQGSALRNSN